MIPISILFFLLIIILILIICSIIVGSVHVREISGGNKYFEKNKYFGGDNDTLFTKIMGYLKLAYRASSIKIRPSQIIDIINNAYKIKYGIQKIFDKNIGKTLTLFQYYSDLNRTDTEVYLGKQNINSIQKAINGIIDKQYIEDGDTAENDAIALNMASNTIEQLTISNYSKINSDSDDDSSTDSNDSSANINDSSANRFYYPQQLNKSRVILPSSENSSIDSNSSRILFSPVNGDSDSIDIEDPPQSPSPISRSPSPISRSPSPISRSPSPIPRSRLPSPIPRSRSPSPISRSPLPNIKRSNSPLGSQYKRQQKEINPQRHNAPLRGRSQNDNSSFDEELDMAETNAKKTESALGDIKDNLYSKMNQDKINQDELYKFVDNIRHTEYQ